MREDIVREDLEKEILGFFKRGGKIDASTAADRWGFDDPQEFRMFVHQLRNKLDLSIHPSQYGPNQPGAYKLLTGYGELKEQSIKSFKRGAGYMTRSGRRSYAQCQIAAKKLLPGLSQDEREAMLDDLMALEASIGNAYVIVSNICRRLAAPQGEDGTEQLRLPSGN